LSLIKANLKYEERTYLELTGKISLKLDSKSKLVLEYGRKSYAAFPCSFLAKPHPYLFIYFTYVLYLLSQLGQKYNK